MKKPLDTLKARQISIRQATHPDRNGKSNISAHGNMQRLAKVIRTGTPEFADERTKFGSKRDNRKAWQRNTGIEPLGNSTRKM
jgi:hypothetical protein